MALTDVKSEQIQSSVALAGSPTTTTQSASDNSTKIATTAYVETAVANLVASAPSALNTLDELAAALNDDASFSTTVTNSIATKLPLAGGSLTGSVGFRTTADSNYAFIALQNSSLTHGGYMSIQGGTATGLEINASASSFSGTIFLAKQSQATTGGYLARFANSAGDKMVVETGGNVGIGRSSPTAKLHVYDGSITLESPSGSGGHYFILNNTDTGGRDYRLISTSNAHGSLGGGDFAILDHDVSGNDADRTRLLINSSGNVGIGTSSPGQLLHVSSSSSTAVKITGNFPQLFFEDTAGSDLDAYIVNNANGLFFGKTNSPSGSNDVMALDLTNKRVGIGTSPTHSLHVLSAENKAFLLDRSTANEPASLNEFSSYYALSIKNRASGSYLNFGGGGAGAKIQATDGAGSATAKYIILQPYGGLTTIGGNVAPTAALTVIGDSGTQGSVRIVPDSGKGSEVSHIHYGGTGDWYIRSASTSGKVIINDQGGDVGIGTSSPLGRLHVKEGSSGVSAANTNFDQLILEDDLHSGMSILSGSSSHGAIYFGDSSTNDIGQIKYRHDSNQLDFTTNSQIRMIINSNGEVGINDTPGSNNAKLAVGGAISQDPGSWTYGNLLRRLTISGPNSAATFTRTINISTQLGFAAHGGAFMYMLHGWSADSANGMVHWRNNGSGTQVIADVYQNVYTASGITVTASKGSGDLEIDLTIASAHNNTHGWYFVIWW